MVQFMAKLQIECTAGNDYFPKNLTRGQKYNVIGVLHFDYQTDKNGKRETRNVIKFLVVNDREELQQVDSQNCKVFPIAPAK